MKFPELEETDDVEEKLKLYLTVLKTLLDSTISEKTFGIIELRLKKILLRLRTALFNLQNEFMSKNTLLAIVAQNFPPDNMTVKKLIQLETKFHGNR